MSNDIYCVHCMNKVPEGTAVCPWCQKNPQDYQPELHHLPLNTILYGKYMIGRVLGEGGFGITYIARDLNLDIRVAVKEYYPYGCVNRNHSYSEDITVSGNVSNAEFETGKRKLMGEARTLAIFSDLKGIVGVRDFFLFNNTAYIVMDYLEGTTFKEYLKSRTTISFEEAVALLMPVMEDLVKVHETGLIHRDISPDNIMILKDGTARLMDFGAARQAEGTDAKSLSIVLKPGYTPEEQYRSRGEQGPWTDVYALCATIYKAVTGILPDEALQRLVDDTVKAPSELGVKIPKDKEQALMKGLAVFRKDRYQNMTELINGLKNGEKSEQTLISKAVGSIATEGMSARLDNKVKLAAGVAAVAVIGIILIVSGRERAKKEELDRAAAAIGEELEADLAELYGEDETEEIPENELADESLNALAEEENAKEEEEETESTPTPVQRSTASKENILDSIGDSLEDYEIMIDGVYYKFPMSYQEFKEKGWKVDYGDEEESVKNDGVSSMNMKLDGSKARILIYNPDNKPQILKDCYVSGLEIEEKLVSDYIVFLPKEIMFGKSTRKDIVSAFGDLATAYDAGSYTTLTYSFEEGDWVFYIDNETEKLISVRIKHSSIPEGFMESAVSEEKTEEEKRYKEPQELGDDVMSNIVMYQGDLYQLPCPLSAMLENGWNIATDTKIDALAAGDKQVMIHLTRNGETTLVYLGNFDKEAHYLENCFVMLLHEQVFSNDYSENLLVLPGGITFGMEENALVKILENGGYVYEKNENNTYSVYRDKDTSSYDGARIDMKDGKIRAISYRMCEFEN